METLNLNKLEAKDGEIKIIRQRLNTPTLYEEGSVSIKGTISAVGNFIEVRKNQDPFERTHVRFSYRERYIGLETNEQFSEKGYAVVGSLVINPDFEKFGINTQKTFGVKDLVKHIRMNRLFFEDKTKHGKIVEALQNFTAKVNTDIKKINDNRGNIEDVFKTTLQSNQELNFNVLMPVFIGEEPKSINVEIACAADNSSVNFWFESPDLIEHFDKDTKTIIDQELKRIPEGIVIIEQ